MSNIEWTDATWNPTVGCAKVAQGCKNCYAEKMSKRLRGMGQSEYGDVLTIEGQFNGQIRTRPEMLDKPLRWKKPRMVFVNSMSDLFHKDVPFEFIAAVYGVMAACPRHTFQVLTKRPERMREFFEWWHKSCPRTLLEAQTGNRLRYAWATVADVAPATLPQIDAEFPLPNVWHVVSASTQPELDENVRVLFQVPSAIRGVSLEPLVSEVYLQQNWLCASTQRHLRLDIAGALQNKHFRGFMEDGKPMPESAVKLELERRFAAGEKFFPMGDCPEFSTDTGCPGHRNPSLDWVIVGGESGPGARPFDIAWARSIIQQCKAAGVACFVKQLGAAPYWIAETGWWGVDGVEFLIADDYQCFPKLTDRKGGAPEEWPEDLRVREFPKPLARATPK